MDPLFPEIPADLSAVSDEDLATLEAEHLEAQKLIRSNDADFLGDLNAAQIIEQATAGKAQLLAVRAEKAVRLEAMDNYGGKVEDLTSEAFETVEEPEGDDEAETTELSAETVEDPAEEVIVASAEEVEEKRMLRPPTPSKDRKGVQVEEVEVGTVLTASAELGSIHQGDVLDRDRLAKLVIEKARRVGKPVHGHGGTKEKYLLASAQYRYPTDRILTADIDANAAKIKGMKNTDGQPLVASGGLCAPLTPIYTIPQFASVAQPVWNALPSFQADRGGINHPIPTTLDSAMGAITVIEEAEDALGGTYATKACLDQTCLEYQEVAVTIVSHCREFGNLNARAWPESVAFENDLTMAGLARTSEQYLLDRIKALSINVTTADVYSTTHDFIYAITRAVSGIRYRLRTGETGRMRALIPSWVPDMMISDIAATQFDRFVNRARVTQILRDAGVDPVFYFDTPTTGTTQGFADEAAGALDDFPDVAQWALYPEGVFLGLDGGVLELGIVRDSTLNSTNDFEDFGEKFINVARLGPVQSALWITSTICPSGEFPSLVTALTC